MPTRRLSDFEWLKKRLGYLIKHVDELSTIEKGIYNPVNYWSALKLIGLGYCASSYTRIISKQNWIKRMYYIDLFSGSGICEVEGTNDLFLGSPIVVADAVRKTPFTKMFLIDSDKRKIKALEERIEYLSKLPEFKNLRYEVISKDCNIAIQEIADEISNEVKKTHTLVFVDPFGMQVDWPTMESIFNIPSDVIITLQTFLMATRVLGKAQKDESTRKTMERFIGGTHWNKTLLNSEELLKIYKEKNIGLHREIAIDCAIKGMKRNSYYYDWIYAAKKTGSKSPFVRYILEVKGRIENLTGDDVRKAVDQLKGKDRTLDSYIGEKQTSIERYFKS